MKIDALFNAPIKKAAKAAQEAEFLGYDAVWLTETGHNPFLPMVPIATHTQTLSMGTGIAVALARSPMTLAQEAWDLAEASGGRFILGLGSQVKGHIVRRFSMPWDKPVEQMRDMIGALRAIWHAFQHRTPLQYEGPYYKLSLLTPFFSPSPMPYWEVPVYLSAVGEKMTSLGAEVAQGLMLHAFTNIAYIRKVTLPAIEAGLQKSGRSRNELSVAGPAFVITGDEGQAAQMEGLVRQQIAFYGSTPAYSEVLAILGHLELHQELHRLSKQQKWADMAALIPADVVDAFAVRAPLEQLGAKLVERYGPYYDRLVMYLPLPASNLEAVQTCLRSVQMSAVS
ncbi:MAG TPA: TIGR03617 family F420-dependent LLM class oxidoreductase [Candidatus Xenobia bacterium]